MDSLLIDIMLGAAFLYGFWNSPGWQTETPPTSKDSDGKMLGAIWGYKAGEEVFRKKD